MEQFVLEIHRYMIYHTCVTNATVLGGKGKCQAVSFNLIQKTAVSNLTSRDSEMLLPTLPGFPGFR